MKYVIAASIILGFLIPIFLRWRKKRIQEYIKSYEEFLSKNNTIILHTKQGDLKIKLSKINKEK